MYRYHHCPSSNVGLLTWLLVITFNDNNHQEVQISTPKENCQRLTGDTFSSRIDITPRRYCEPWSPSRIPTSRHSRLNIPTVNLHINNCRKSTSNLRHSGPSDNCLKWHSQQGEHQNSYLLFDEVLECLLRTIKRLCTSHQNDEFVDICG